MIQQIRRSFGKIREVWRASTMRRFGRGAPVPRRIWEAQFAEGVWNYLETEEEAAHYQEIVSMCSELPESSSLLDVGCGAGVLLKYLRLRLGTSRIRYSGIDISENAISQLRAFFPEVSCERHDPETASVPGQFDAIVFNESLYYFKNPMRLVHRLVQNNLNPGGILVVSMCEYGAHDQLWHRLERDFPLKAASAVTNGRGQRWFIKTFGA